MRYIEHLPQQARRTTTSGKSVNERIEVLRCDTLVTVSSPRDTRVRQSDRGLSPQTTWRTTHQT